MEAFLQTYGLWIVLAGVFLAMHWFGRGCGGGHAHRHEDATSLGKGSEEKGEATGAGRGCH